VLAAHAAIVSRTVESLLCVTRCLGYDVAVLLRSCLTNGVLVTYRGLLADGRSCNLYVRRFGTCPEVSPYWPNNVDITYVSEVLGYIFLASLPEGRSS
jgi:hypothetical protein